jgi:hypothetical protein
VAGPANITIDDEQGGLQAQYNSSASAASLVIQREESESAVSEENETLMTAKADKEVGNV